MILEALPNDRLPLRIAQDENSQLLLQLANHEVVKDLLKEGADINALDNKWQTILVGGESWGYVEIIDTLVKAGAALRYEIWTSGRSLLRNYEEK